MRPIPSITDDEAWNREALALYLNYPDRFAIYANRARVPGWVVSYGSNVGSRGMYELGMITKTCLNDSKLFSINYEREGQALLCACRRMAKTLDLPVREISVRTNCLGQPLKGASE
jgi:hypothetical protein